MAAGMAARMIASNTPMPPGTWLITPAMVAAAKTATKVKKPGAPSGSSRYRVSAENVRSPRLIGTCPASTDSRGARRVKRPSVTARSPQAAQTSGTTIAAIANSAQTRIVAGATGIIAVSAVGCSASAPSPTSVVITPKDTEVKVEIAAMS